MLKLYSLSSSSMTAELGIPSASLVSSLKVGSKTSLSTCMHATLFMTASLLAALVYRKNTQIAPPCPYNELKRTGQTLQAQL